MAEQHLTSTPIAAEMPGIEVPLTTPPTASEQRGFYEVAYSHGFGSRIFKHVPLLDRIRLRVASRWTKLCVDESLHDLTEIAGQDISEEGLDAEQAMLWLSTKCPNLNCVSVRRKPRSERHEFVDDMLIYLEHSTPQPVWWKMVDTSLEQLALKCAQLTYLDVQGCTGVTDKSLILVSQQSANLTHLEVSYTGVTDVGLTSVGLHSTRLKNLIARGLRKCTDASVSVIGQRCRQLEHLDVKDCQVTDASILTVARHCPALQWLDVSMSTRVTDCSMAVVAELCPQLRHLNLVGCSVGDATLRTLGTRCPRLQRLELSTTCTVTDAGVRSLGAHCPDLVHLNLGRCTAVTDAGIQAVGSSCPRLQHLWVQGCDRVTDASIRVVAVHVGSALTWLACLHCRYVTDASISVIARCCPQLQRLDVSHCTGVTDASLTALGGHCPQLQHLAAGSCPGCTDATLVAVSQGCQQLQHLFLQRTGVTDAGLIAVGTHSGQLQSLILSGCAGVTEVGLAHVLWQCKQLFSLAIQGCMGIRFARIRRIAAERTRCTIHR
eukprot:jgi/Mesvir1/9831/Mv14234-RA.1